MCATYNHVNFIEDAIKGFIAQKTDFPFEVIIHDDASTDGTQEVIKRYAEKYPDLIRPIYQKENQYSQNRKPLDICLPLTKGRYVAICEGDDYWTDPKKLKIQFDYMERHPDCVVTHHNAFVFDSCGLVRESKLPKDCIRSYKKDELLRNDCFLLTLSMMFRKKFDKFPKEKGNVGNGDNFLISMLGLYGESASLECVKPAAYRLHADSTWSSKTPEEKQKMLANSMKWISIYHEKRGRKDIANYYAKKAVF
ncbi:glycosyltransferase [Vreelandella lionensis]|uniref:glycosyltransferase n=1 Tax=Vreelandella lionensis TaxID=1144478 RepID=UPI00137474B2|nr:glycosyltransferase [Halomonas lionensis]